MRFAWMASLVVLCLQGCVLLDDPETDPNIPQNGYCAPVATWDSSYADLEEDIRQAVNAVRARGASCGSQGSFPPAEPLAMHGALQCAARVHSMDMYERGFFDHTNPDNESPFDRMDRAGYLWRAAGENIAQGYPSVDAVMAGWMSSDGHCANIMSDNYTEIGVGFYDDNHWTQTFGRQ